MNDDEALFGWLEVLASAGGFHEELPEHADLDRPTRLALTRALMQRGWVDAVPNFGDNLLLAARRIRVLPAGIQALSERRRRPRARGAPAAGGSSLQEKRERRLQFMNQLYDLTDGSSEPIVDMFDLGLKLGWDRSAVGSVAEYLEGEGLIKYMELGGGISITHQGVVEVEEALGRPDRPTEHFPPAGNVIHIGSMVGSQIVQGSPEATVNSHIIDASVQGPALDLVRELRETVLPDLILEDDDRSELAVELQTAELQLALPKPKARRVQEALGRVAEILTTASVVGGSTVQLAQYGERLHQILPGL